MQDYLIRNIDLAPEGRRKIDWVRMNMPVLNRIEKDFRANRYFEGVRIAISVHLEAKTAYLAELMQAGGAEVAVCGSNPKSTKDDVVAALAKEGIKVYAWFDASPEEFRMHQRAVLSINPNIVIDDGGDLVHLLHTDDEHRLPDVWGACEETTAGVLRNRARQKSGDLRFPVLAVNSALCKHLFDNRYGTGQSTLDALMRSTNKVIAGATVVVAGYGWCGKGIALRASGMGARVIVTEVDPIKALEAAHEGYQVMTMKESAAFGDFFITTTGTKKILSTSHFEAMKDGAVLANAGHFFEEIDTAGLSALAVEKKEMREHITGYRLKDGRWVHVISDGKIVNISAADGHPAEIMDMSFALQALAARYVAEHRDKLGPEVVKVPDEIDHEVALYKLKALGISIDRLSAEQKTYYEEVEK